MADGSTPHGDPAMAQLARVLGAIAAADFDIDFKASRLHSAIGMGALFGLRRHEPQTLRETLARVHRADMPALNALLRLPGEPVRAFQCEFRIALADGSVRWLHARGEITFEHGAAVRGRGVCFDVTERRRSEEAARESEARYRALAQLSPVSILVVQGGRYVYANGAAAQMLGAHVPQRLVGMTPEQVVAQPYRGLMRDRIRLVLEQRAGVPSVRSRWMRLDGGEVDVDVAAAWVQWGGEDAVQIVARDVTQDVKVEHALRESRSVLAGALDDAQQLQAISTRLLEAGDAAALCREMLCSALHVTRAGAGSVLALERPAGTLRIVAAEGIAGLWQGDADSTPWGRALALRCRVVLPDLHDGATAARPTLDRLRAAGLRALLCTPLLARDGTPVGMLNTGWHEPHVPSERETRLLDIVAREAADLLERHHALRALADSEERFRRLVESNAQAVWEADAQGLQVVPSPTWHAYTGQSDEEARGAGWAAAVHPDDRAQAQRAWQAAVAAQRPHTAEFRLRHAGGRWRWTQARAVPLADDTGRVRKWVGMNLDIDAQRRLQLRLDTVLQLDELLRCSGDTHALLQAAARVAGGAAGAARTGWALVPASGTPLRVLCPQAQGLAPLDGSASRAAIEAGPPGGAALHVAQARSGGTALLCFMHFAPGHGVGADEATLLHDLAVRTADAAAAVLAATARRLRVLVVDDNRDAAESLAAIVNLLGHDARLAPDGEAAIAAARSQHPDVVLCDIGLPGIGGHEVARRLKADGGFRGRLVAVSGHAQPDDVQCSLAAGFDAHLAKPFDPARLEALLG